jgi:hypothetical protein
MRLNKRAPGEILAASPLTVEIARLLGKRRSASTKMLSQGLENAVEKGEKAAGETLPRNKLTFQFPQLVRIIGNTAKNFDFYTIYNKLRSFQTETWRTPYEHQTNCHRR